MAISKCDEIVITRKRFSDFTLLDPVLDEDIKNVYLAGYSIDENGHRENVKIKAATFLNKNVVGTAIGTLDEDGADGVLIDNEQTSTGENVKTVTIESDTANFIQINKIDKELFTKYGDENKKYVFFRLSDEITFGTVIRFYLPNFPRNKGVMIWPTPSLSAKKDIPVEVFFNDVDDRLASDFYFTLIQLADPQNVNGTNIATKTKVIEVNNITQEL